MAVNVARKNYLHILTAFVKQTFRDKIRVQRILAMERARFKPGAYFIGPRTGGLFGAEKPSALALADVSVQAQTKLLGLFNLAAFVQRIVPPYFVFFRSVDVPDPAFTHLYANPREGYALFSTQAGMVLRSSSPETVRHLEEARGALGELFPVPLPGVELPGYFVERLIDGIPLNHANPEKQLAVYEQLVELLIDFNSKNQQGNRMSELEANNFIHRAMEYTSGRSVGERISACEEEIFTVLINTPLSVTHGDLHRENIIVSGDKFFIIDYEFYHPSRPFWFDLFYCAFFSATRDNDFNFLAFLKENSEEGPVKDLFEIHNQLELLSDLELMWLTFFVVYLNIGPTDNRSGRWWAKSSVDNFELVQQSSFID